MTRSLACRTCIHNEVCECRTKLRKLQDELNDALEYMRFNVDGKYALTSKLKDFDFIKTVKIECEYYLRDASISED